MFRKKTPKGIILIRDKPIYTRVAPSNIDHYRSALGCTLELRQGITVAVGDLPEQSNKSVTAICPLCRNERPSKMCNLTNAGHSYCQPCRQRLAAYGQYIGQKIGRLQIMGFANPASVSSGGDRTTFAAVCDCGNETTIYAQSVKRALAKDSELSCGCVGIEQARALGIGNAGSNNGMYNPLLTDEEREQRVKRRKIEKAKKWSRNVRKRDGSCVVCGGPNDVAHHLNSFMGNEDQRHKLGNGIALCETHHLDFHYGFMGGTHNPCTAEDTYSYLQEVHEWSDSRIAHLKKSKSLVH